MCLWQWENASCIVKVPWVVPELERRCIEVCCCCLVFLLPLVTSCFTLTVFFLVYCLTSWSTQITFICILSAPVQMVSSFLACLLVHLVYSPGALLCRCLLGMLLHFFAFVNVIKYFCWIHVSPVLLHVDPNPEYPKLYLQFNDLVGYVPSSL